MISNKHIKPPSELRALLALGIPVALIYLANMTLQLVDVAFVGRLGPEAIGGVSVANATFSLLMIFGVGLLLGLDYLIPRAVGAGNVRDANRSLVQAFWISTLWSLPVIAFLFFFSSKFAVFGIPQPVAEQAFRYLRVLAFSLWPWLIFVPLRQYLQAFGAATPIFLVLLAANGVNALANYALVFGHLGLPALGIAGSAFATLIARFFMLAATLLYLRRFDRKRDLGVFRTSLAFSTRRVLEIVRLGVPAGIQLLFEIGVFATATFLAGRLGAIPLAAHQLVLQIASLTFMVPLGLASASTVRVALAVGGGDRARVARVGWLAIRSGAAFMGFCGFMMVCFSGPLIRAFSQDAEVLKVSSVLLLVAAFFQLFDGVQVVGTGVLRGVGNTRASMIANFVGHWMVGLPVGALLCFVAGWGVTGIWIGLSLGLTVVALALLYFIKIECFDQKLKPISNQTLRF